MRVRSLLSGTAAAFAAAAGLAIAGPPPEAAAEPCGGATGVTVVVDYNELGEISTGCDNDGGNAADNFTDAGFPLTYATRDAGFVCQVSGLPDDESCSDAAPPTAYWSLWWSDGKSGAWTYSSLGVGRLKVPDGGYVAFAWHQGSGKATPPDVTPTPRRAQPSPSGGSTTDGGGSGSGSSSGGSGSGKADGGRAGSGGSGEPPASTSPAAAEPSSASPSATRSASPGPSSPASERPSSPPSPSETTSLPSIGEVSSGPPQSDVAREGDDGLPRWPLAVGAGLVLGAAAGVPLVRARR